MWEFFNDFAADWGPVGREKPLEKFFSAIQNGDENKVRDLFERYGFDLNHGIDLRAGFPDLDDSDFMHEIQYQEDLFNGQSATSLKRAVSVSDTMAALIVSLGARPRYTDLIDAVRAGRLSSVKLFMAHGAAKNPPSFSGYGNAGSSFSTVLHYAIELNHNDIALYLAGHDDIDPSVSVNYGNAYYQTAIERIKSGQENIAKAIIKRCPTILDQLSGDIRGRHQSIREELSDKGITDPELIDKYYNQKLCLFKYNNYHNDFLVGDVMNKICTLIDKDIKPVRPASSRPD